MSSVEQRPWKRTTANAVPKHSCTLHRSQGRSEPPPLRAKAVRNRCEPREHSAATATQQGPWRRREPDGPFLYFGPINNIHSFHRFAAPAVKARREGFARGQALFPMFDSVILLNAQLQGEIAMPRPPRIQFPGAIYHVITRGDAQPLAFWALAGERR